MNHKHTYCAEQQSGVTEDAAGILAVVSFKLFQPPTISKQWAVATKIMSHFGGVVQI